jgi:alpha-L-rhamnosidase
LQSRQRYYWKVRVWDAAGRVSESVEQAWWEMGLLHATDWKAKWIRWQNPEDEADLRRIRWIRAPGQPATPVAPNASTTFRTNIKLTAKAKDAVLFVAARGGFVANVNGHQVDAKTRWAAFDRLNISDHLIVGKNSIEVTVTAPKSPSADGKAIEAALAGLIKITRPRRQNVALSHGFALEGEA